MKYLNQLLIDAIVGGIVTASISHLSSSYSNNKNFYGILAFLWAFPLTLPFMLYLVRRQSLKTGVDATKSVGTFLEHAALGYSIAVALVAYGAIMLKRQRPSALIYGYSAAIVVVCVIYFLSINQVAVKK